MWFQHPLTNALSQTWVSHVIAADPDVYFTLTSLPSPNGAIDAILTAGFFSQSLNVYWTTHPQKRWDDPTKVSITRLVNACWKTDWMLTKRLDECLFKIMNGNTYWKLNEFLLKDWANAWWKTEWMPTERLNECLLKEWKNAWWKTESKLAKRLEECLLKDWMKMSIENWMNACWKLDEFLLKEGIKMLI